jgi:tetratricopeptide (TPR) repeat protein
MFEKREAEKEKARCEQAVRAPEPDRQVEGHLCLARLALAADTPVMMPVRDRRGQVAMRPAPGDAAASEALAHYKAARKLAPGRIDVHREILKLVVRTRRALELPAEVRECVALVPRAKRDALLEDALQPTFYQLTEDARFEEALAMGRVLEKEYPRSNQVVSNVGGTLMSLGREDEALPYLERAVALAPKDPIDRWNLGQWRAKHGRLKDADRDFAKAVSLATKPAEQKELGCRHASFVWVELQDRKRACELQKRYCNETARGACDASAAARR